ncbi:MAG: CRISPR-associated endonuclease Cas3'', partial [Chromatiales bacterium]
MTEKPYFRYWGKARKEDQTGEPYHLLPYHCLDVAAVGKILLETHKPVRSGLAKLTGLDKAEFAHWFVLFLALHDLGKFATSFQQLLPDYLIPLQQKKSRKLYTERHDCLGYELWKNSLKPDLQENGLIPKGRQRAGLQGIDYWALAVTGHHGQPPKIKGPGFLFDDHFEEPDRQAALSFTNDLIDILLKDTPRFPDLERDKAKASSWWFAGFSVLCDWLGSNQD